MLHGKQPDVKETPQKKVSNARGKTEKVKPFTREMVENDIDRTVIYTRIIGPHALSSDEFSKVLEYLETLPISARVEWLNRFAIMPFEIQKGELKKLLL